MPTIKVNGIEIYYEVHGKGTPLICIEGFTCNRLTWEEYVAPLSAHYQLIIFDNRGSGQSSSPEGPYTIEMLAEDTAGLLKALHVSKCFAIGHSMGAAILQQLCLSHPELVRKGILANAFAKAPNKWKWQMEWTAKLIDLNIDDRLIIEGILPWIYSEEFMGDPEKIQQAVQWSLNNPYPQPLAGLKGQTHALAQFDLRPHLKEIRTPLVVAAGDEDIGFPLFCAEELVENIPEAELYIFQGQAHMILDERKEEFLELIKGYFE